ncbi:uncharacterized protein [Oryza sativa Japonica Group]|uniref:uncharacterized protein isoform X2 n=1 Tax=Oryza sativa subsp. japonica TaxID=39947 RepID=UPI00339B9F45
MAFTSEPLMGRNISLISRPIHRDGPSFRASNLLDESEPGQILAVCSYPTAWSSGCGDSGARSPPLSAPAAKTRCRPPHAGSHVLSYKGRTRSGTKAPRSGGSRISAVGARHGAAAMAPQPPPATILNTRPSADSPLLSHLFRFVHIPLNSELGAMAELLSALLPALLKKAGESLSTEFSFIGGIEHRRSELYTLLLAINQVIYGAEEQASKKPAVKSWITKLKLAACDADDALDELHYEALRSEALRRGHKINSGRMRGCRPIPTSTSRKLLEGTKKEMKSSICF